MESDEYRVYTIYSIINGCGNPVRTVVATVLEHTTRRKSTHEHKKNQHKVCVVLCGQVHNIIVEIRRPLPTQKGCFKTGTTSCLLTDASNYPAPFMVGSGLNNVTCECFFFLCERVFTVFGSFPSLWWWFELIIALCTCCESSILTFGGFWFHFKLQNKYLLYCYNIV